MSRYDKYFLQHILYLEDDFCQYFVQDDFWGRQEILDVEHVIFDWKEDAEQWMVRCINWDPYNSISRLRRFLAADCLTQYQVHRMNDRQVVRTAARELCRYAMRTVIKPRIGWAAQVDPATRQPVPSIAVEPAGDIDGMLAELKKHLDAIVAEAQKKKKQHQAALAGKSSAEVALYYSGNAGDAVFQSEVVDTWDDLVSAAKKFPGFYKGFLKAHWKLFRIPGQMAQLTAQALYTGDMNPLKEEIDKIVDPVVHGYEQAMHYKSILTILLGDQQTYALLWDFARRYYDASHPVELARLGATAAAEIVVTILLALVSYGIGAAANIAARSTRLVKVTKLLERIALSIKKTKRVRALVDHTEEATARTAKIAKQVKRTGKGIPDVQSPKAVKKVEHRAKKGYDGDKGPKTTEKTPKVKKNHPHFKELKELNDHAKKRAAELKATMSNRKRGPVLTVLKDKKTGQIFEGLNDKQVPSNLHPVLKKRLDRFYKEYPSQRDWPHPSDPGTHSEIYALDKALKARDAAGMKVTEKSLKDFSLYNETLYKKKTGSVPCCANCTRLLDDVESLSGKLREFHGPK